MSTSTRLRPWLQLVRLPNVFTAAADSLAGWLVARGSFHDPARWLPLLAASMTIYAAGIALNDYFDRDLDRQERPFRPIPSGAVAPRTALILAIALLSLGLLLAVASGSLLSLAVAAALVSCVVLYDASLRRFAVGPLVMGACRGLNFLLGASHSPALGGPLVWLSAVSLALFVAGLTWISRSETLSGRSLGTVLGLSVENLALLGLLLAAFLGSTSLLSLLLGTLILLAIATLINRAGLSAFRTGSPQLTQLAVKTSVLSLVWLNVALVSAVRGPLPALAVAALWPPAFLLAKWLYAT